MIIVCAREKYFFVKICLGHFLGSPSLERLYGKEPYLKIDRIYDLGMQSIATMRNGQFHQKRMSAEDLKWCDSVNKEEATPMEVMYYLFNLD